jgi:hypothetical protein
MSTKRSERQVHDRCCPAQRLQLDSWGTAYSWVDGHCEVIRYRCSNCGRIDERRRPRP